MSTDLLRRAAALMRERAEAATPGPWEYTGGADGDGLVWRTDEVPGDAVCGAPDTADAEHVASWHPDAALAVADWLDGVVTALADGDPEDILGFGEPSAARMVARAYLGGEDQ